MKVITRSNEKEEVDFNKVKLRLVRLAQDFGLHRVNPDRLAQETISHICDGITTRALDDYAAKIAASWGTEHYEYLQYAAIIAVDNLHKQTTSSFVETMEAIQNDTGLFADTYQTKVRKHASIIDKTIDYRRDFLFDFIGFQTLSNGYLLKSSTGEIMERPQHMHMRVALALHDNIEEIIKTYDMLSQGIYTHATPTLFNSGTIAPQLASCFLLGTDDSIKGIFKTVTDCALVSKEAGGIGVHLHNIRAAGTHIRSTNGKSNGIVPMIQVFNATARYVDQGGGKRKGSFAMYLEPWHADIYDFLELRRNTGDENMKARDIFLGLWVPDLFMKRVEENGVWSLMCPKMCPGLSDVYGDDFERLYTSYEAKGQFRRQVRARDLMMKIMEAQIETGVPYMCYKDAVNRKSAQHNIGIIKSSNLCSEIMEYSSADEYAVCNLASINLRRFVREDLTYDFQALRNVAYTITRNLDRIIDLTRYPTPEAERSNKRHRPIGLGVQGLADVLYMMRLGFEGQDALQLNAMIFESIYHGAVEASADLASELGSYPTFEGSPWSQGKLQFDLWNHNPTSGLWDWEALRQKVKKGMRNSLLTAVMPTASTSQILGNYECIEPPTTNIFVRRTLAGQFTIINKYLVNTLDALGLWNEGMKNLIIYHNGSIQAIETIPDDVKKIYKTAWEIPQRCLIDLAISRAPFVDQSQSLNLFMQTPDFRKLLTMHMHGWKNGLKTGMYYLRSAPAADALKFSLGTTFMEKKNCDDDEGVCLMCSA